MGSDPASSTASLAPGFRFHPTDEELVRYYLKRKVCRKPFRFEAISDIDVYKSEPWDLPGLISLSLFLSLSLYIYIYIYVRMDRILCCGFVNGIVFWNIRLLFTSLHRLGIFQSLNHSFSLSRFGAFSHELKYGN
ncbi:hypothetical protein CsSME_00028137 [Camellia sinensis var. sinensis]